MPKKTLSLREKKHAATKKIILEVFLEQLRKGKTLEEISIREISEQAEISEGTFFNYFPSKSHLLIYFIHLWSIEAVWEAERTAKKAGPLKAIERVFSYTAERMKNNNQIMNEIIAHLARECKKFEPDKISKAEYLLFFNDKDKIDECPAQNLDGLFLPFLKKAVVNGELNKKLNLETALLSLRSIFFGVPISIKKNPEKIKSAYQELLSVLWKSFK